MIANKNMLELCKEIHAGNAEKGFWDDTRTLTECVLLSVGELYEALEAHRKGRLYFQEIPENYINDLSKAEPQAITYFESVIKDTVGDELADFCIRVFDFVDVFGVMPQVFKGEDYTLKYFVESCCVIPYKDFLHTIRAANKNMLEVLEPRGSTPVKMCIHNALCEVLSYCIDEGIDIIAHIEAKLLYNATRPYKHGKKY